MDGEEEPAEKAGESVNVIYQTAEDGVGDTIKLSMKKLELVLEKEKRYN